MTCVAPSNVRLHDFVSMLFFEVTMECDVVKVEHVSSAPPRQPNTSVRSIFSFDGSINEVVQWLGEDDNIVAPWTFHVKSLRS